MYFELGTVVATFHHITFGVYVYIFLCVLIILSCAFLNLVCPVPTAYLWYWVFFFIKFFFVFRSIIFFSHICLLCYYMHFELGFSSSYYISMVLGIFYHKFVCVYVHKLFYYMFLLYYYVHFELGLSSLIHCCNLLDFSVIMLYHQTHSSFHLSLTQHELDGLSRQTLWISNGLTVMTNSGRLSCQPLPVYFYRSSSGSFGW